jgi:hypothetical protein
MKLQVDLKASQYGSCLHDATTDAQDRFLRNYREFTVMLSEEFKSLSGMHSPLGIKANVPKSEAFRRGHHSAG